MEGATIGIVMGISHWPAGEKTVLRSTEVGSRKIDLVANPGGYFSTVETKSGVRKEINFQRVVFDGSPETITVFITVGSEKHQLRIEAQDLEQVDSPFNRKRATIKVLPRSKVDPLPEMPQYTLIVPDDATDAEWLFIHKLYDVQHRIMQGGEYNILQASGLLRHVFLDERPLFGQVKGALASKPVFLTNDFRSSPSVAEDALEHTWQNLSPERGGTVKRLELDLNSFLSARL